MLINKLKFIISFLFKFCCFFYIEINYASNLKATFHHNNNNRFILIIASPIFFYRKVYSLLIIILKFETGNLLKRETKHIKSKFMFTLKDQTKSIFMLLN